MSNNTITLGTQHGNNTKDNAVYPASEKDKMANATQIAIQSNVYMTMVNATMSHIKICMGKHIRTL